MYMKVIKKSERPIPRQFYLVSESQQFANCDLKLIGVYSLWKAMHEQTKFAIIFYGGVILS